MPQNKEEQSLQTYSKNIIESYIFATSKRDLNIVSERLLLQLVKAAQSQIYGINFRDGSGLCRVDVKPLETVVDIDVKELLGTEGSTNYTHAKEALKNLMEKKHESEQPLMRGGKPVLDEAGHPVYQYEAHHLVNDVYVNKTRPGSIQVVVNRSTWEAILDFSKGYRRYDLLVASKLKSIYALRMYKIISNQKNPISFSIAQLKEMWGVQDKYPKNKDFIKNITNAKKELDEVSPWTFEYDIQYSLSSEENRTRKGRPAATSIIFFPKKQLSMEATSDLASMVSPTDLLGKEVTDLLLKTFCFSYKSISANMLLFNTCKKNFGHSGRKNDPGLEDFLIGIKPSALRAGNTNGYVINALKIHLKENFGISFQNGKVVQSGTK